MSTPMTRRQLLVVLRFLATLGPRQRVAKDFDTLIERIEQRANQQLAISQLALAPWVQHLASLGYLSIRETGQSVMIELLPYGKAVANQTESRSIESPYPASHDQYRRLLQALQQQDGAHRFIPGLSLALRLSQPKVVELLLAAEESNWLELVFDEQGQITGAVAFERRRVPRRHLPPLAPDRVRRTTARSAEKQPRTGQAAPKVEPAKRAAKPAKLKKAAKPRPAAGLTKYQRRLKAILSYLQSQPDHTLTVTGSRTEGLAVLCNLTDVNCSTSSLDNALYGACHQGFIEFIHHHSRNHLDGIRLLPNGETWLSQLPALN